MDQVHVIRYKVQVEGQSSRRVAREMGLSRNTVRRYLEGATPGERQPTARPRPVREKVEGRLQELLDDSKNWTQGKQKLTAARLWEMLRGEGFEVGETLVKKYVREWRRQQREVFVPLEYPPGDMAQVDFFEVLVDLAGVRTKAWMFVMRLMHSKRDFAWLYPRQDQVCFLDGHVRAFEHFGAVPNRIVYDNLRPAVVRVLAGSERELTARFQALAAHYVFEPCFARPATGHDKGGVESRGKAIRWQHLVPIPAGDSLAAMGDALLRRLDEQYSRSSNAARFDADTAKMLALPARRFRAAAIEFPEVSRRSLVRVAGAVYSAPSEWADLAVTAIAGVDTVELRLREESVIHERQRFGGKSVRYRHYLRELARKPQALRQVAGKLINELGEPYGRTWRLLVDTYGPKDAARVFASVLKVVLDQGEEIVARKLERALASETPLPLALADTKPKPTPLSADALPESFSGIDVEAGHASDYDALAQGGAS